MDRTILFIAVSLALLSSAYAAVDVQDVSISPSSPDDNDMLECSFRVVGNVAQYQTEITWRVDGTDHTADDQSAIVRNNTVFTTSAVGSIEREDTEDGDIWECVVTATDGEDSDTGSDEITISGGDRLVLSSLSAKCDPSCDDDDLDADGASSGDAGRITGVNPGATLTIEARAENTWPDGADDHDIEDVTLECTLEDIGDDDEVDEDIDFGDLDPDERSDRESMEFDISSDAEDNDEYDIDCTLSGEDQDGTDYDIDFTITVEAEKDDHDVQFTRNEIKPSAVDCSRRVDIAYTVQNLGSSDEDDVEVIVESPDLKLFENDMISQLQEGDRDDDDTESGGSFSFTVDKDVDAGVYPVKFEVFFDDGDDSSIEYADLTVNDCVVQEEKPEPKPQTNQTVEVVQVPTQKPEPVPVAAKVTFTDTPQFVILLAGAVVVLLLLGAYMISAFSRR
jgi:hypothetical protein